MAGYQYRPLDSSKAEIRVLRPVGKQQSATSPPENPPVPSEITVIPDLTLEFELHIVSLQQRPVYTTLSYRWGSEDDPEPIIVDGSEFPVTRDLIAALRHLSTADIGDAIWIDMICINQSDEGEKDIQLRMMSRIYSNAVRCTAWLGETTENSDYFAECSHALGQIVRQRFQVPEEQKYNLYDYLEFDSEAEIYEVVSAAIAVGSLYGQPYKTPTDFLREFVDFLSSNEWWFRVWIIQEFVLSPKVVFQIGNRKIVLEELSSILLLHMLIVVQHIASQYASDLESVNLLPRRPGHQWIMWLLTYRERCEQGDFLGRTGVFELLCRTYCQPIYPGLESRFPQARYRRDQIWALYSLFENDFKILGLEVDHRKYTWQDVYCDVAQRLLQIGCLDLLCLRASSIRIDYADVPSWVPVWHEAISSPSTWFGAGRAQSNLPLGNSLFAAGILKKVEVSFGERSKARDTIIKDRYMRIGGIHVDTVLDVTSTYPRSSNPHISSRISLFGRLFRDIKSLQNRSESLGYQVYNQSQLSEAAWRMPIWDHELPTEDQGSVRRATYASKARYEACVPFFKIVEAYASEQRMLESLYHYNLQAVWAWPRMLFYRVVLAFRMSTFKKRYLHWREPRKLIRWLRSAISVSRNPFYDVEGSITPDISRYIGSMESGRPIKPFITKTGYIGLGPPSMQPDDVLCVLFGSNIPHILRPLPGRPNEYRLAGGAYVYGIMDGEIMKSNYETATFTIY
ncbi:heterokaryon incompatibility protein-domain-containing protein [Xylariaceae sp. FL1651]|nr:heterokaryon incompatibility protein-domain-containing protein [Xylariaceae sp. FL1651]